jgi:hypothetical protein
MYLWDQTPFLVLVTTYTKQDNNKDLDDAGNEMEFR